MTALVVLHPRSIEKFGVYQVAVFLRTKGYEVPDQPGSRFARAYPEVDRDTEFRRGMRTLFADWINFKEIK